MEAKSIEKAIIDKQIEGKESAIVGNRKTKNVVSNYRLLIDISNPEYDVLAGNKPRT